MDIESKKELYLKLRSKRILKARRSLWEFQKVVAPNDYKENRTYLIILAICLQSFYEDKPIEYISPLPFDNHQKLDLSGGNIDVTIEPCGDETRFYVDLSNTDTLIIEIPRRHHKSHSLILFESWIFGQDPKHINVTAAHNANLANDFSTYVRNEIEAERLRPVDIIYSDIFPNTRTKYGERSKAKWALEGNYLSYAGSGILSPVTGRGGNLFVMDDPVRGALEAFNEDYIDKLWMSYTNGWLQVIENPKKQILVMTPWVEGDPGDRIIKGAEESGEIVKLLNMTAYTPSQGMLCEEILNKRAFDILKSRLDPVIFSGNYLSKRIPNIGRLYPYFRTYAELPELFEEYYFYIDTADEGSDYLCCILAGIISGTDENDLPYKEAYFLDVYYTQEGMEITEPETASFLARNYDEQKEIMKRNAIHFGGTVESNSGGRSFARNLEKELESNHPECYQSIVVDWFHQDKNKKARIVSESHTVMKYCLMPEDWEYRWPSYHKDMSRYIKDGKNSHDDCADATTGVAEYINTEKTILDIFRK